MKNYLIENRFKFLGWTAILVIGITLGFMARPGFDKFALAFVDKPYVATMSDFDQAVADYAQSETATGLCRAQAREHVAMEWTLKMQAITGTEQAKIESYMTKSLYGISEESATATIALETKAGRR